MEQREEQLDDERSAPGGRPEAQDTAGGEPEATGGEPEAAEERPDAGALERELEQVRAQAAEYLETARRLKADFDNYRRRMFQEQSRWKADGVAAAVLELLPVADNLERALASQASSAEALRQGVELTLRQMREALARLGVEAVAGVGQPFDPAVHEAVQRVEGSGRPEGEIVQEIRKGYRMKDRLLRPALVAVAAGTGEEAAKAAAREAAAEGSGPEAGAGAGAGDEGAAAPGPGEESTSGEA
ncbi:MAG: nucleotide exchange factor GrpE [Bacillota bacterium]|nr:nucleotide exchange factor GrpE [Bacillota bacterium]